MGYARDSLGEPIPTSSTEPRTYDAWRSWCKQYGEPWEVPCSGSTFDPIGNVRGNQRGKLSCQVDPLRYSLVHSTPPVRCGALHYYIAPQPVDFEWRRRTGRVPSVEKPIERPTSVTSDLATTATWFGIAAVIAGAVYFIPRTGGTRR